jgi:hypothetical protein
MTIQLFFKTGNTHDNILNDYIILSAGNTVLLADNIVLSAEKTVLNNPR